MNCGQVYDHSQGRRRVGKEPDEEGGSRPGPKPKRLWLPHEEWEDAVREALDEGHMEEDDEVVVDEVDEAEDSSGD